MKKPRMMQEYCLFVCLFVCLVGRSVGRVKNQHLHTPPTCGSTSGPLSTVSTVTYKKCASQQIGPTVSFIW